MANRASKRWYEIAVLGVVLVLSQTLGVCRTASGPHPAFLPGQPPNKTIRTEVGLTPEELVKNVFAGGTCNNISNIKGLGNPDGIGYFENGKAAIGLDRGIILATGPIAYAANSNSAGDKSGDFGDKSNDPDLGKLATGSIRDRVGLEFDFVPLDSFVTFRYVFASEEYCEFVGSKYNDVFGFFVRGAGINGGFTGNAQNVALIPGSSDFVSINNVNHKKNSQHYIDNTRNHDAERCGIPYTFSEREAYIEYDGFTVQLTAVLKLDPCETYHIRMVVADVADNFYDSAVFLEAGSFDLGGEVSVETIIPGADEVSEGCTNAYFEFKRQSQSIEYPLNIRFLLDESTTATPGEDFVAFPPSVTIPAGQRSIRLPIEVLNDDLSEGAEKVSIQLDIPCACYTDGAEFTISDPPELIVAMDDLVICPEQTGYLVPSVSGGNPEYSYLWNDGSTRDRLPINEIKDEPYFLTVTDRCGHSTSVSARVIPSVPPSAGIEGMEEICEGDTALLKVNFSGVAPWNFTYTLDGEVMPKKEGIMDNPYFLEATREGDYELVQFADSGCGGEVSGLGVVNVLELPVHAVVDEVSCKGGSDGGIRMELMEDHPPYRFSWDELPDKTNRVEDLPAGTYTFRMADGRGCSRVLTVSVPEPDSLVFPEVDCEAVRAGEWTPLASGGTPPYEYYWQGNVYTARGLLQQWEPGREYVLEIEDNRGCRISDTLLVPRQGVKTIDLPPRISLLLGTEYQFDPVLGIPESLLAGVRWLPAENLSCDDCLDPVVEVLEEGIYTIRTIDRFGCTDEASAEIVLNTDYPVFVPNVFSPNGDEKNDRFGVLSHPAIVRKIIGISIFNRWGSQVFEVKDVLLDNLNATWDGRSGGRLAPSGIYVYQIDLELTNGDRKSLTGDVLLIR